MKNITWNSQSLQNGLKITLWKNDVLAGKIADNIPKDSNSYSWTVGQLMDGVTALPGTGYTIKIKEAGTTIADASDAPFSITGLLVTSPNGGEQWIHGESRNIQWGSQNLTNSLKISLWKNDVLIGKIAEGIPNSTNSYPWIVGNCMDGITALPGAGYIIKIKEVGTTVADNSDSSFTLKGITISIPAGGESWTRGTYQSIAWNAYNTGNLNIILMKNGITVGTIASNIAPGSSPYSWNVGQLLTGTAVPGYNYTIKIQEQGTAVFCDSNAFSIKGITLIAPNGGELWPKNQVRTITWEAPGITSNLRILLLKYDSVYGTVASSVNAASGSFQWLVGHVQEGTDILTGSKYKIRIVSEEFLQDSSDYNFSIVN